MNLSKDKVYNIKLYSKSNTLLLEKDVKFLYGYYKKDHALMFWSHNENRDVKDFKKLELSNKRAYGYAITVVEKEYNYNGEVVSEKEYNTYVRKWELGSLFRGKEAYNGKEIKKKEVTLV